jgi:hypothetical protein
MQVILIQTEIEQAIRDYINSQINIKEGMSINIDLRSTRGTEGFTANIDIMKPGVCTVKVQMIPKCDEVVQHVEPEPVKEVATVPMPVDEPLIPVVEPVTQEEQPKKSLFGALRKPVNEPTLQVG